MRQLNFIEPGRLEWHEAPDPELTGPGQALVEPLAVAACDLDRALLAGAMPLSGPFPLGHEFVGRVVQAGDEVSRKPGEEVVVSFQISCGTCDRCRRGITGSCLNTNPGAMYGLGDIGGKEWGGAFADLVKVPFADFMLFSLPEGVRPEAAASANDNVVDAYRTVGPQLLEYAGADVLIVGGGAPSIALYAVDIARALGADKIDYIDQSKERLAMAERLGATPIEGPPPEKAGRYPVTVDASTSPDGLRCAVRSTEAGGICTSIGIYYEEIPLPLLEMYSKGITFKTGRPDSCALLPEVLELLADDRLNIEKIHTFSDWDNAIEALLARPTKLVVRRT